MRVISDFLVLLRKILSIKIYFDFSSVSRQNEQTNNKC